jgi:hypothetical protein
MHNGLAPDPAAAPHPLDAIIDEDCTSAAGHSDGHPPDLQLCPACRGRFVVPGCIHEVLGDGGARLDLVCTACGWMTEAEHDDAELEALEHAVDRGFADLLALLETVARANQEEEIARFAGALAADALVADDF